MSLFWWATVFLLLYYGTSVSSFPLNDIQMEPKTRSHSAITSDAVYKAVATFLDRMQLVSNTSQPPDLKVKTYFGTGKIIKTKFRLICIPVGILAKEAIGKEMIQGKRTCIYGYC